MLKTSVVGKVLSVFGERTADAPLASAEHNRELIEKLKGRLRRDRILAASLVGLICILAVFAVFYEVALPFDGDRMLVELVPSAFIYDGEFDEFYVCDLDQLTLEQTKGVLAGKGKVYDLPRICYRGINDAGSISHERMIRRDGKEVLVVYFGIYKTLWRSLFFGDLLPYSESFYRQSSIYAERYSQEDASYRPVQTEFYYLQDKMLLDPEKVEALSDAEFDALRNEAVQMWKGVC